MTAPFLSLQQVAYGYPGRPPIVDGVDWRLDTGAFHCLVGRSGCGKTTLLKLAAGLMAPQSGRIQRADGTPAATGPHLGYVFQAPTLLAWRHVIDNVLLPVSLQHRPVPADIERAHGLLALLGLAAHAHHYPRQLSGGQQSRVALARALILDPALLLLDEPFAALDAITRGELQDDLLRMCRARGTTVLFVTHDIAEAVYLGDHVAVMQHGRLVADVAVALPAPRAQAMRHEPAFNHYCAQVYGAMTGGRP
ncbi:ABC transporter ATP-binding protein [Bordetella ansorpii]|uniref:ABC transporter ATP-binding protein n=1 Tax=Bordetella ansorpii TaxID=288768 RepID=A0A157QZK5_9BORD|nr:ABC transporter ATP-binding protein [Bordetella ansorpii]SAI51137.1 ABC transporter ATP-binding protein [Bordetella ansorpii]